MVGCVFWRVPRNTTPTDSDKKVDDTANSGGVGDTVVQLQLTDDNSGSSDANNTGEPEDEPEDGDGQQRNDSRLKSPSFFQQKQHE